MDVPEFKHLDHFYGLYQAVPFSDADAFVDKISTWPMFPGQPNPHVIHRVLFNRIEWLLCVALGLFSTALIVEEAKKRRLRMAPHATNMLNRGSPLAPCGNVYNSGTAKAASLLARKKWAADLGYPDGSLSSYFEWLEVTDPIRLKAFRKYVSAELSKRCSCC